MYKLTLTANDRSALYWIGDRYRHGAELVNLLTECADQPAGAPVAPYPLDSWDSWDSPGDVTFTIPEHTAWQIHDIVRSEDPLSCIAEPLCDKLYAFCDSIV